MDSRPNQGWIAVVGQWRKGYARLPLPYTAAVEASGGTTRVLSTFPLPPGEKASPDMDVELGLDPSDPSPLEGASGLVLPGGGDIDPEWYGCPRHPRTKNVSHRRDRFELTLLRSALEHDIPILAICHGMQLLNVHLGGTLDQHLADDAARLDHDRDRPRAEPVHDIRIKEGSLLARIVGATETPVNSHHHQGLENIGPGLEEIAWSGDGVLEAVELRGQAWALGVQWHPEAMAALHPPQKLIFDEFVHQCATAEPVDVSDAA
ncbi:MAG TPA: gamma-glutamyl-gamma-aminobutyrate hydrolase family protein [Actinomycetota bacterium]